MREVKLKKLEELFEAGLISKKEYEKKKKEIGDMPEEKTEEKKEKLNLFARQNLLKNTALL